MDFELPIGLKGEISSKVTEDNTAFAMGSGTHKVYATAAMIALMEEVCVSIADPRLPEGINTVGIHVDIKHLKATVPGNNVRAEAKLVKQEGKKLFFEVNAFDSKDIIGTGKHTRFIIETEKFLEKANQDK